MGQQKGGRKLRRSGKDSGYYAKQAYVTLANKKNKRAAWLRKMGKRWALTARKEADALNHPKVIHKKRNPGPNLMGHEDRSLHTIRFTDEETRKVSVVHDLRIEGSEPEGFKPSDEKRRGGIHFLTKNSKKWFLPFQSFNFVIPAKE